MRIDDLLIAFPDFVHTLNEVKAKIAPTDFAWYPYGSLYNVPHLGRLLSEPHRDLSRLIGGRRVADIGGADGEMAFFFERQGVAVDVIDWPATNYNGLRGARALKEALGSTVRLHEVDLDAQFQLPEERYGLVLFLGILYHLKNPFYVLEALSHRADWCLISTRIARHTPDGALNLAQYPLGYLLDPTELNNDDTNYWIFSEMGLRRILDRTGWEMRDFITLGDTLHSDPVRPENDERAFCLVQSRRGLR